MDDPIQTRMGNVNTIRTTATESDLLPSDWNCTSVVLRDFIGTAYTGCDG